MRAAFLSLLDSSDHVKEWMANGRVASIGCFFVVVGFFFRDVAVERENFLSFLQNVPIVRRDFFVCSPFASKLISSY